MVYHMTERIEEPIQYVVDELEFTEDQNFAYFDFWVKIKIKNGVLNPLKIGW